MNEHGAAVPEAASTDRDAVTQALMAFGRRYLDALESQGDEPMPSTGLDGWRSDPRAPYLFVPLQTRLPPPGFDHWEEYKAMEALVMERAPLRRLITEPMNASTDRASDFGGLMHGIVALPLMRYEAIYGSEEHPLADLIGELADWFCRDADPMLVAMSVVGFTAPEPVILGRGATVRRPTDDEVSAMLKMGVLNVNWNPNPAQTTSMHVAEAARWIVALDYSPPRFSGASPQKDDERNFSAVAAAANDWLAALRILTPANVWLGPTFMTELVGGIMNGGWWGDTVCRQYLRGITRRPSRRIRVRRSSGSLGRYVTVEPVNSGLHTVSIDSPRPQPAPGPPIASLTSSSRWNRCSPRAEVRPAIS